MALSDIGNLLDSDGNLQNELLVFAFAATLLATIPILLGNEFDVSVGLKRRRRRQVSASEEPRPLLTSGGATVLPPADSVERRLEIVKVVRGASRRPTINILTSREQR